PATAIYPLSLHDALPIWDRLIIGPALSRPLRLNEHQNGAINNPAAADQQGTRCEAVLDRHRLQSLDGEQHLQILNRERGTGGVRSEEHTSELQSRENLVC